jgi:RecB family endonuclease NucS
VGVNDEDVGLREGEAGTPSLPAAAEAVRAAFAGEALVTLRGRCRLAGGGLSGAGTDAAVRLVCCKPDGAVVVHDATGVDPVARRAGGGERSVSVDDGELVLEAGGRDGQEPLRVVIDRVGHVQSAPVPAAEGVADGERPGSEAADGFESGSGEAASEVDSTIADDAEAGEACGPVPGTEAALRERLLAEPSLLEPGFTPLATERETPAGPVDVYGEDAAGRTVVVELKRRRVGPSAVGQLSRYVAALERDLHTDSEVRGVLAAPSVTDRARRLLREEGLEFVALRSA